MRSRDDRNFLFNQITNKYFKPKYKHMLVQRHLTISYAVTDDGPKRNWQKDIECNRAAAAAAAVLNKKSNYLTKRHSTNDK